MEITAVLLAPHGAMPLRALVGRLINSGVEVTTVFELDAVVPLFAKPERPPCLLVDLREVDADELDGWKRATEMLGRIHAAIPAALPVVVTDGANAALILACIRAGAADVIDLELEGTGVARAVVQRVWVLQAERVVERSTTRSLRGIVEELVKDLVRTERRSIDLEERLHHRTTDEIVAVSSDVRSPAILLVEHERSVADELVDRLEAAGVATYAYVSGEEALREARTLAEGTGLDLALVAAQLPGIDGLETIRRLREAVPRLAAFLVTSIEDADLAADAADLGVVGFLHKPLADIEEVVARLAQLAQEALQQTREHLYLQRIKQRHERVLARYRALPREA